MGKTDSSTARQTKKFFYLFLLEKKETKSDANQ